MAVWPTRDVLPGRPRRGPLGAAAGMICSDLLDDTFWPDPADTVGIAAAKAICEQCPMREPCLDEAMSELDWSDSVRGGLTGAERRTLARDSRRDRAREKR